MSAYHGRKAPNMSQYLRDLNTISPQDSTGNGDAPIDIQDELSFFANTQFYDLDSGQNTDFQAPPVKPHAAASQQASTPEDPSTVMGEMSSIDFMNGDFNFSDFNAYQGSSSMNSFTDSNHHGFQPLQPNHGHGHVYGSQGHSPHQQGPFPHPAAGPKAGDKRKASTADSAASSVANTPAATRGTSIHEEAARMTAEEDKRRRNTAASARFRIKKKQREQALEKSAKEMSDKVSALESRVSQLETENKWLKNLLVEKNEGNEDITTLWKEFTQQASRRAKAGGEKR